MSPADLQALIAAAAPGARVTIVTIEIPGGGGPGGAAPTPEEFLVMPKPWVPAPGVADRATGIAARDKPFTAAELAAFLDVKPDTIGAWCRAGALPGATKTRGAGWRIPPAAVVGLLAASAPGVPVPSAERASAPGVAVDEGGSTPAPGSVPGPIGVASAGRAAGAGSEGDRHPEEPAFDVSSLSDWRRARRGGGQ